MVELMIPRPKKAIPAEGVLTLPACISFPAEWKNFAETFCTAFQKIHKKELKEGEGGLQLILDRNLPAAHYVFDSNDGLKLMASDTEGICSAMATALQLVESGEEGITVERVRIEDHPDKDYRGLMVDLARVWHPFKWLLRYVDICFLLKLKYLHIHFIDDQGYRLPSKTFPKISTPGYHYSFEEIKELCAYAKARGVILIPEFEAPGHAASLNREYRSTFGNEMVGEGAQLVTEEGVKVQVDSLLCAGKPETMEGIRTLLAEIVEMFPDSPYIHIGGDEAAIQNWNHCVHCQNYMAEKGIEDVYELYSEFVGRVADIVFSLGRTPIVWEGFPKKGLQYIPRDTVVIAWESHYHMAYDLVAEGFKIINCSWAPLYIVDSLNHRWSAQDIMNWNVYEWDHWWEKSEATLNPIHLNPTEQVWGGQVCMWEMGFEQSCGRVVENCAALSERVWNLERTVSTRDWSKYNSKMVRLMGKLIYEE